MRQRHLPGLLLVIRHTSQLLRIHAEFPCHLHVRVRQMIALPRLNPRPELLRNEFCFRHRLRDAVKAHNAPRERRRHRAYHEEPTKPPEGFSPFVTSMTAPVASGRSGGRVGLAPTGKRRLTTAHTQLGHLESLFPGPNPGDALALCMWCLISPQSAMLRGGSKACTTDPGCQHGWFNPQPRAIDHYSAGAAQPRALCRSSPMWLVGFFAVRSQSLAPTWADRRAKTWRRTNRCRTWQHRLKESDAFVVSQVSGA